MKKTILLLIFLILIIISTISYADSQTKAVVNVEAVRIRENMSVDSQIKVNLYKNDEVEVLEENGEWYKIQNGKNIGYSKKEFFTITQKGDNLDILNDANRSENTVQQNQVVPENTVIDNTQTVPQNIENIVQNESIILANAIKVRLIPNIMSIEKFEIALGETVNVKSKIGKWCKISNGTISGWIIDDKLNKKNVGNSEQPISNQQPEIKEEQQEQPKKEEKIEDNSNSQVSKTGIIFVETARVRSGASSSAEVINTLDEDEVVTIVGEEGNFYKITSSKVQSGYISKSLIKEQGVSSRSLNNERENTVNEEKNEVLNQALTTNITTGKNIVEFAQKFLGYKYVSGASLPEKGFDCSGFTKYVFGNFKYILGSTAASQTSLGTAIERGNLQTGDLLLFYDEGKTKIGHCGIYIDGGNFIHSANPQRGVVIDNLNTNSYYSERFVTARRIAGG